MRTEESAGGVVINCENDIVYVLLLKDFRGNWTFPKGLIEAGEDKAKTAAREIAEEVGLTDVELVAKLSPVKYKYRWEDELVDKTVYYYLFKGDKKAKLTPQAEEGIQEVKWFPFEEALKITGYKKTSKEILNETRTIFSSDVRAR